ncbi:MAG TPA: hypothetical protein VKT75_16610 [Acidobacteriaceae bacterium]|nr:hypothetical protein [Acidobacteriaceae bacterium]
MPDLTDSSPPFGFPAATAVHCALSAMVLESLSAIAAECDLLRRTTLHSSLTKHVRAIEACVADMVEEIAGNRCGNA